MISSHAHRSTFAFSAQLSCTLHAHIPLTAVQFTITCMSRRLRAHDQHAATRPRRGRDAPKQRLHVHPNPRAQPAPTVHAHAIARRFGKNSSRRSPASGWPPWRPPSHATARGRDRVAVVAVAAAAHSETTGDGSPAARPSCPAAVQGRAQGHHRSRRADSCSRRQCQCEWPTEIAAATALAATVSLSCHVPAAIFSESCPGSTRTLWPTTCHQ